MADSISIGSIFGIKISLHWTFILLLLFALFISAYFFLLMVVLFVCVLIHELAHSVTSKRNGINVKSIILLPIGGASIMDITDISPRLEFNIAIVGPLMSLALGFIFGFLSIFAPPGIILEVFQFLFEINILLGVFNLLPAFPMDGGRVFRAWEQRKHTFFEATMITVKVSKYLMAAIIVATLAFVLFWTSESLSYRLFLALWDFIIVIFLYGGAQAEEQNVIVKENTKGLTVRDVLSKGFIYVGENTKLHELYSMVKRSGSHIVITRIGDDYAFVDLMKGLKRRGVNTAREIAISIPRVSVRTSAYDAMNALSNANSSIAAVVSGRRLVGIVTSSHLQTLISLHMLHKSKNKGSEGEAA